MLPTTGMAPRMKKVAAGLARAQNAFISTAQGFADKE
jgi:hypothetical protein